MKTGMKRSWILIVGFVFILGACQRSSSLKDLQKQEFQLKANRVLGNMAVQARAIRRGARGATVSRGLDSDRSTESFTLPFDLISRAALCRSKSRTEETVEKYPLSMLLLAICLNQDLNRSAVMPFAFANLDQRGRNYYTYLNDPRDMDLSRFRRTRYPGMWSNFIGQAGELEKDMLFEP